MKKQLTTLGLLSLTALFLPACNSAPKGDAKQEDRPIPLATQKDYLAKTVPPQQFGLQIYRVGQNEIAYTGKLRLHPNHLANVEMLEDDIPLIKMTGRASREKFNALIDPSSPVSWMEFSTSRKVRAHFLGIDDLVIPYRGTYNTGGVNAYAAVVDQMHIDTLFMENIPLYVRMSIGSLGALARGVIDPRVDAVIGYDNLQAFEYIQFNFREKTLTFSADTPYEPKKSPNLFSAKILPSKHYGLVIKGGMNDQPSPIVLDLSANYHFARGDLRVTSTAAVELGDLELLDLPTLVLPFHNAPPRIGRKAFSNYLVTVCPKLGIVYFEKIQNTPES
jgi:hypothetical protein